jgi:glucose-6-phosphate dehydrogenase assembly protein OpcA
LPFVVRTLLVGDLPTNLWWATPEPPPLAGPLLYELAENAQQIIYDSHGWQNPHRGVAGTAAWLAKFERGHGEGRWRVASDLNWRRTKSWRRILGQALDPGTAPGALDSMSELLVEHGPHAVCQAWQLVAWLASRLGWQVQSAKFKPGVEVSWQMQSPTRSLKVRIGRLPEGPPEIRHVRLATAIESKPTALNIAIEDERRLAVLPEESGLAPRTMTVPKQALAELVGRQLSDRERDPVFRESMAAARVLADSILAG